MCIIGIDFSINSTAIAIKMDNKTHLFSFVPNYEKGRAAFKIHDYLKGELLVKGYEKSKPSKNSIEEQSNKLLNADRLSESILDIFNLLCIEDPQEIRIEGFSYMSKGNSFIDLITYNTFLKVKLIQKFGHIIKVVPPKTLKKSYTSNGNASKCDMMRYYVGKSDSKLKEKIVELNIIKEEDFTIPKPLDDIIDAIALTEIDL